MDKISESLFWGSIAYVLDQINLFCFSFPQICLFDIYLIYASAKSFQIKVLFSVWASLLSIVFVSTLFLWPVALRVDSSCGHIQPGSQILVLWDLERELQHPNQYVESWSSLKE